MPPREANAGNGWMVHSSGSRGGVALSHLDDYIGMPPASAVLMLMLPWSIGV